MYLTIMSVVLLIIGVVGCKVFDKYEAKWHSNIIKAEVPDVEMTDMDVYNIPRGRSDRHAGHTMVTVHVKADVVSNNLDNYISL